MQTFNPLAANQWAESLTHINLSSLIVLHKFTFGEEREGGGLVKQQVDFRSRGQVAGMFKLLPSEKRLI